MGKDRQVPLNIWNDIERCWVLRMDIVFEGKTITGIHHSEFENVISDIDWICKKLQQYKSEMQCIYKDQPPQKRSMLKTYIYIILDQKTGYHKIGRSIDPQFREKTLQAEKPSHVMIWISPLTHPSTEKIIHKYFASKRIRGEWFNLNVIDIEYIQNYNYGA